MADKTLPLIQEARLGRAPPKATLRFTIPRNGGYTVEATLFQGTKPVASWESREILGKTTDEELLPTGIYTLLVDVVFTKTDQSDVTLEFSSHFGDQQLRRELTRFKGVKGDIGRTLAMLRIEKP